MELTENMITTKNVDISKLPALTLQILEKMQEYPEDIVLTRVGDFFEAYFEDAIEVCKLTGITLTSKIVGKNGEKLSIPMAGVPHKSLNDYALRMVNENRRVVVIEQLEDPKTVKSGQLVKRGVVQIITSSTVVEDGYINQYVNNYLCVIYKLGQDFGLCFGDISTGEIYMTTADSIENVINEISRYKPIELLLNTECFSIFNDIIKRRLKIHINITIKDEFFNTTNIYKKIENSFGIDNTDKIKYNHVSELYSLFALLSYIDYTQCIEVNYGSLPFSYSINNYMIFDIDTRRNLELCENITDRKKSGTLLSVLDRTSTVMGSRLLRQWVDKPLVNKAKIDYRLSAIEELLSNEDVLNKLRSYLDGIFDISRIMGRLKLNKSAPRDLLSLRESLKRLPFIKKELGKLSSPLLVQLYSYFNTFEDLSFLLEQSICDDPVSDIKEGLVLKSGYNKELDIARAMVNDSNKFLVELEERERSNTGIKNLKVVNIKGLFIDITKSNISKVPSHYVQKSTLTNSNRYVTDELQKLELELLSAVENSKSLEIELYNEIKTLTVSYLNSITVLCEILSTLDVLCSLSYVSIYDNYTKPNLNIDGELVIKGGRHPVVENMFKEEKFICNDVEMNMTSDRYLLITGPNMAGKSTYMRQVALITIMAHIGCYVPADYANIPITDRIFTRIGASDDIVSGRSTYMVEMEEVCNILKNSTTKSLVLLDEVGRGTSTSDGLAIAQAITEYIHNTVGCKTLFATHYHELIGLEKSLSGLKNYHMSVGREDNEGLVFLRKIKKGGLSDSYGIDVAKLAGIPDCVVERAWDILSKIDSKEIEVTEVKSTEEECILAELKGLDLAELSPISSYRYLSSLIERVKNL